MRGATPRSGLPAALLAALSLAGPASAAQDPVEEALLLARSGQVDNAESALKRLAASPMADFLRSEIVLSRALVARDPRKFQELLDDSIAALEKFLKGRPGSPPPPEWAGEARRGIDWRRHKKAERAAALVQAEADARRQRELFTAAAELYEGLEFHYHDRLRQLEAAEGTDTAAELAEVRLAHARALLEHARLSGLEPARRKTLLEEAIERLTDLQFDFCDAALACEAAWLEGQCRTESGDLEGARSRFRRAAELRRAVGEAGGEENERCLRVIRGAEVSLVDLCMRAGQWRDGAASVDRALGEEPGLEREPAGRVLQLLKAECLFQLEDVDGARELAAQVARSDPGGEVGAAAEEKIRTWSASGSSREARGLPARLIAEADSLMERDQWLLALKVLREAIDSCAGGAESSRSLPEAFFRMGQCQLRLGRRHEAAFAFRRVIDGDPRSELAPRACFEAARALAGEFALSGDPEDEVHQKSLLALLLKEWPDHPTARNVAYLDAEKAERAKEFRRAAELYESVPENAEARLASRVGAARCRYALASEGEEKAVDPAAAKDELEKAEKALKDYFTRAEGPGGGESGGKIENLSYLATQQLALVYLHPANPRAAECLQLLEEYTRALRRDDERVARIWALEIRAHLLLDQVDEAVKVLEAMFERFPDHPSIIPVSRSVAIRLQKRSGSPAAPGGDPSSGEEDQKRIIKYYLKWLESLSRGQTATAADLAAIGDAMLAAARRLNRLGEEVGSVLELWGAPIKDRRAFREAAFVLSLLVQGKGGPLQESERLKALGKLARCRGFAAADVQDWQAARSAYSQVIEAARLLRGGKLDPLVLKTNPLLLSMYLELGAVCLELGKAGQKVQFESARDVFSKVIGQTSDKMEAWWIAKYHLVSILYYRGTGNDINFARSALDGVEKNNPGFLFEGDRFKMQARFLDLKDRVARVLGGAAPPASSPEPARASQ